MFSFIKSSCGHGVFTTETLRQYDLGRILQDCQTKRMTNYNPRDYKGIIISVSRLDSGTNEKVQIKSGITFSCSSAYQNPQYLGC